MRSPLSKHPGYPKSTQKKEIQITSLMNFSLSGQQEEKECPFSPIFATTVRQRKK